MGLGDWLSNAWGDFKDFGENVITSVKEGTNWFIDNAGEGIKKGASKAGDIISTIYDDAKIGGTKVLDTWNNTLNAPKSYISGIFGSPTAWLLAAGVGLIVVNKVL